MKDEQELIIEIKGLNKSFGNRKVLQNLNLNVYKGENVVVLGKSGSGKSVLIKCIIGLIQPDSGILKVFGTDITDLKPNELDKIRARIGFLFQNNALYDSMTVRENLEFPLRRHWLKLKQDEVNDRVMEALSNVRLQETVDMIPSELSGGMRKRIALARTLIMKPDIILYDEPTTGLDPLTSKEIASLMNSIHTKYHTSSLIISHDMNCIKLTANRIVMLLNGNCDKQGTYNELKNSTDKDIEHFFK